MRTLALLVILLFSWLCIPVAEATSPPVCVAIGTLSEGWSFEEPSQGEGNKSLMYANCAGCTAECSFIGTQSEGWYSSCDGSLIQFANCAGAAQSQPQQDFPDVPPNSPFFDAVNYVKSQGIVSGYPDGNFLPDRFINRAEFTKIVIGAAFTPQAWERCDPNNIYSFSDAGRDEWYSPFLCVAVQHKIVGGYPNGSFMPSLGITFVEAAKILVSADRIDEGGNPRYDRSLPSVGGEWYAPYVEYLSRRGAIPIGISSLSQNITRWQLAEIIYRLRTGVTTEPSRTFTELMGQ